MNILIKKVKGIDRYLVLKDGEKTEITVSFGYSSSSKYYLVYQGNRLKGRFDSKEEVMLFLRCFFLEKSADSLLGKK